MCHLPQIRQQPSKTMQIKLIAVDPAQREEKRWPVAIGELEDHYLVLIRHVEGGIGSTVHAVLKSHYTKEGDDLI